MKKKKITQSIQRPLHWLGLVLIMLMGMLMEVHANSATYYYKATATPSPAAAGKVYIATEGTNSPAYQAKTMTITGSQFNINNGQQSIHLYAQANDNYLFSHWALGTATGNHLSTSTSYTPTITFDSESKKYPTTFNYYAVFVAQTGLIKVKSADDTKGSVNINNRDNQEGDVVTLSANPDASNGVMFLGWTKGAGTESSTDYISTTNPLVLTANSETKGLYIAHFSDVQVSTYVRIQNKKTGRFISFYGTSEATVHQRALDGNTKQDGFKFTGSLKMISAEDAQGNPETVFLRGGQPRGSGVTVHADLTAHHTQYSDLVDANPNNNQYMLTIEKSGDTYHIYTPFTISEGNYTVTLNSYFCDDNEDYLVMKTTKDLGDGFDPESAEWYIYTLDANTTEGAFGANAKEKYEKEGKYYTTMYADFAYQCLDGVKAYYLPLEKDTYDETYNLVRFAEVPNGIVPANMAVVLECNNIQNAASNSPSTVTNRLLPLFEKDAPAEGSVINEGAHYLKGYVSVNGKPRNNAETYYVLSKINTLGFYRSSKSTMTPNKAYLDTKVSLQDNPNASTVKFAFGQDSEGETNKISLSNIMVDDSDAPVFDLLGRRMTGNLPKGIYIRSGKKFVVK